MEYLVLSAFFRGEGEGGRNKPWHWTLNSLNPLDALAAVGRESYAKGAMRKLNQILAIRQQNRATVHFFQPLQKCDPHCFKMTVLKSVKLETPLQVCETKDLTCQGEVFIGYFSLTYIPVLCHLISI